MQTIKKNLPGIAVCLSIAIPSWLLGKLVPVIGFLHPPGNDHCLTVDAGNGL